ncbi:MAG: hypothetical protein HY554_11150 [Elusimicrobia bacterium]|nr:hypothetical protein [Elusimicrobiota bacterium]
MNLLALPNEEKITSSIAIRSFEERKGQESAIPASSCDRCCALARRASLTCVSLRVPHRLPEPSMFTVAASLYARKVLLCPAKQLRRC